MFKLGGTNESFVIYQMLTAPRQRLKTFPLMKLQIITVMTNETSNLTSDTTLSETLEKLVQQQLDLLKIAAN